MRLQRVFPALLLLASFAAAHAQYSVASITFKNAGPYTTPELLHASGLATGQLLSQNSLPSAAARLLNTGLFLDAEISYTGTGKVRGLVVDLKPIALGKLLPASFENFAWFTPDELTAGIHAHVPLYRGAASDAGTLPDDIQSALQQMLTAKGITATLSHTIIEPTNIHPLRTVSFRIEQPSVRLLTVHLSMVSPPGAVAALTPGLQQAVNLAPRHPYNEGLSGLTLEDTLLDPFRRAGYIQSALDNLQRTVAPSPTDPKVFLVTYTARIVTGDPWKIAALIWTPTPLYSAADFARDNKLHPGDPANDTALLTLEAAISAAYLSHGYMDVYVLPHPLADRAAHAVTYNLEPIPGDVYRLHTVTPTGLSPEALQEFNANWQMKPGDVYNPEYVSTFVKANKSLPLLSTYAGGFKASADSQTHLVDLTITFTPYNGK
jgi:outer membrane protein insertion porin family